MSACVSWMRCCRRRRNALPLVILESNHQQPSACTASTFLLLSFPFSDFPDSVPPLLVHIPEEEGAANPFFFFFSFFLYIFFHLILIATVPVSLYCLPSTFSCVSFALRISPPRFFSPFRPLAQGTDWYIESARSELQGAGRNLRDGQLNQPKFSKIHPNMNKKMKRKETGQDKISSK